MGSAYSEAFRIESGGQIEVAVEVPRPGRVHGRLLDAAGRPMAGTRLMMQNYHVDSGEQIDGSWTRVITDREGRYAFVGVSPTGHVVHVLDEKGDRSMSTEVIAVEPGETVRQDIRLPR